MLAGIPSIVLGFLGWIALAPLIQRPGRADRADRLHRFALILAYMSLPTIISIAEDALYAVPKEYRDGALAIGATSGRPSGVVLPPALRPGDRRHARHRPRHRRDHGGDDGDRQRRQYPSLQGGLFFSRRCAP